MREHVIAPLLPEGIQPLASQQLRLPGNYLAEKLHQHQRLNQVAHAHAPGR